MDAKNAVSGVASKAVWCLLAVDAKNAVSGVASKAAAGAQRMAGLQPKQGIACPSHWVDG